MLCIKLLAAVLCCQFSVSVESVPVFSVTVDSPAVTPKTVSPDPPPQASRKYLAFFTSKHCGPCQTWKRNVLPRLKAAGYHVELVDMDLPSSQQYRDNIPRYPGFVVCDWDTGKWLSDVTIGGIDLATAERMLGRTEPVKQTVVSLPPRVASPVSIYNGNRGSSHENRSTLINHLLLDGIHAGRRTRATLDAMTDSELDALHNQDHSNVRPTMRRRGLFFR